jgi:membrane protease YdiL (CAAX protease family)
MTSATLPGGPSTSGSRLRGVAARRPLTAFLILGLALGYALAFLWGLAYHGVIPGGGLAAAFHIAPDELTGGAVVLSLLPAALFATWATSGRVGVRSLFRRAFHWRVSPGWWLTVLLGLPVLTVGLALLMGDQLRSINVPSFLAGQLMLLLVNFIVINLWEEVAWTGLFQTRLEERHN